MAARVAFYVNNGPAAETQRARATAMRQWIRVFLVLGRSYLMSAALTEAGIDPSLYASHSFRSGGATAAAAEGVPEYLIKLQGRWASCVFLRYVRKDKRTLADMAAVMGRAEPDILRHGTTKRASPPTA